MFTQPVNTGRKEQLINAVQLNLARFKEVDFFLQRGNPRHRDDYLKERQELSQRIALNCKDADNCGYDDEFFIDAVEATLKPAPEYVDTRKAG